MRPALPAHQPSRTRDERGALTPAVTVMAVGLLLLGGLVTDGGRQLNAKLRAEATAEEAARAGANMIDLTKADPVLDRPAATTAAETYCTQARAEDDTITDCRVDGFGVDRNKHVEWIQVRVQVEIRATLFGLIGINTLHADVSAKASPVQGISDPGHDVIGPQDNPSMITPSISYPSGGLSVPTTGDPGVTSVPVPTGYTTNICGVQTVVPVTVGLTCYTTKSVQTPPPPPGSAATSTVISPYPTSVSPTGF